MIDSFLSKDWAGLIIALVICVVGVALFRVGQRIKRRWGRWTIKIVGIFVVVLSLALAGGSLYHLYQLDRAAKLYPPLGKLYDVGGFKMHILAEGTNVVDDQGKTPTVIWIPGGYAEGLGLYHLHKAMAKETRSIIFDRAGTGWSELGPFPRRIQADVNELRRLLKAAGEQGPFVLVGHSWGGMFANNFAYEYPQDVAGLVLLDATPLEDLTGPGAKGLSVYAGYLKLQAFLKLFSLAGVLPSGGPKGAEDPASPNFIYKPLRDIWKMFMANELKAKPGWAAASSFLTAIKNPPVQIKDEGVLGDVPLFLIARGNMAAEMDKLSRDEKQRMIQQATKLLKITEKEYLEMVKSEQDAEDRIAKLSRKGTLIRPPEGSSHQFPYEFPEFTLNKVREMIALVRSNPR